MKLISFCDQWPLWWLSTPYPPTAPCVHQPVTDGMGRRSRGTGFPEEAAQAQLGLSLWHCCDLLVGWGRVAQELLPLSSQGAWQMLTHVDNHK